MEQSGSQKLLRRAISVLLRRGCGLSLVVQYSVNNWNWHFAPSVFTQQIHRWHQRGEKKMLTKLWKCSVSDTFSSAKFLEMYHSTLLIYVSFLFQVDLLVPTKVTGIITQGAKDFGHVQFVGSYKLAYSNDGERWNIYQDEKQGKDKVWTLRGLRSMKTAETGGVIQDRAA